MCASGVSQGWRHWESILWLLNLGPGTWNFTFLVGKDPELDVERYYIVRITSTDRLD